jgi:hypothetical protein
MPLTSGAGNIVTAEEIMPEDGAVTPNGSVVRGDPSSGEAGTGRGGEVKTVGAGALEPPSLISLCSFSPEIIGTGFDEKERSRRLSGQDMAKDKHKVTKR